MRPQNEIARQRLESELRRSPRMSASDLARQLGVSVPTVLRILREREDRIVRFGTTKNARYASRRALRGVARPIPVYLIDPAGKGHHVNTLELIEPDGSYMNLAVMAWPTDPTGGGWWDGLPYPLRDMRPQGFLGRNFARRIYQESAISPDPDEWSDDDIAYVLTRYGSDTSGNLVIGDQAYASWLTQVSRPSPPLSPAGLYEHYTQFADDITSRLGTGSSAAGEFPKFTASRELANSSTPHVIVKFSGADSSTSVRRWSDLLTCESLALRALTETTSLPAAPARLLMKENGRTFLEVERFDRYGLFGRSELLSLANLNEALVGKSTSSWPELMADLGRLGLTTPELEADVQLIWWYGRLIANTDMHQGNLSFRLSRQGNAKQPLLRLAPVYDMLPMLYAPLSGGEVPTREFEVPLPLPRDREVWQAACRAALHFWELASGDAGITREFRTQCSTSKNRLEELAARV